MDDKEFGWLPQPHICYRELSAFIQKEKEKGENYICKKAEEALLELCHFNCALNSDDDVQNSFTSGRKESPFDVWGYFETAQNQTICFEISEINSYAKAYRLYPAELIYSNAEGTEILKECWPIFVKVFKFKRDKI